MKWLTFEIQRTPGFRFNLIDLGLILFLCGVAAVFYRLFPETSLFGIPLYLGLSFFLFCNVFRIGNRMEPFWYIPFACAAGYGIATTRLDLFWMLVAGILEPLKWGLIIYRIRKGPYRGILFARVAKPGPED